MRPVIQSYIHRLAKADFCMAGCRGPERRPGAAYLLLTGVALWLVAYPFRGIWHDGRFYTLMALRRLDPGAYAADPWFRFGSQDDYSIFSTLYAPLIDWLGLADAAMAMSLLGAVAFVIAAYGFAHAFLAGRLAALLYLLLASVPLSYLPSQAGVLTVTESIVTSRTLAVALSLGAMAAAAHRRWKAAIGAATLAMALHPLMAIGALGAALMAMLRWKVIISMAVAVGLSVFAATVLEWPPLMRMDEFWFRLVDQTSIIVVFPDRKHDPTMLGYIATVLVVGMLHGSVPLRRWYLAALVVGGLGYGASLFAGTVHPVTILLQTQPWRGIWVALVFAVVAVCDLARYLVDVRDRERAAAFVGVATASLIPYLGPWGLLGWSVFVRLGVTSLLRWLGPARANLVCRIALIASPLVVALALPSIILQMQSVGYGLEWWQRRTGVPLADGMLANGGFGLFGLLLLATATRLGTGGRALAAAVLLGVAVVGWDIRGEDQTRLGPDYGANGESRLFGRYVQRGDVVYARRDVERVWFEIGTSSYAGSAQAVGIVLNRQLAITVYRRLMHVIAAMGNGGAGVKVAGPDPGAADLVFAHRDASRRYDLHQFEARDMRLDLRISQGSLAALCADKALDWVVDAKRIPELAVATEEVVQPDGARESLSLYSCGRNLRGSSH